MKKSFLTFLLMLFCLAGFAQQTVTGVIEHSAVDSEIFFDSCNVFDCPHSVKRDSCFADDRTPRFDVQERKP